MACLEQVKIIKTGGPLIRNKHADKIKVRDSHCILAFELLEQLIAIELARYDIMKNLINFAVFMIFCAEHFSEALLFG